MTPDTDTKRRRPAIVVAAHADVAVQPADEIRLNESVLAIFGLSQKAMESKIARGDWIEGREYHRAPDGTIWISRRGVSKWVTGKA